MERKDHWKGVAVFKVDIATGKLLKKYDTITQAADELGVADTNIRDCLKGKQKTSGGYKWLNVNRIT